MLIVRQALRLRSSALMGTALVRNRMPVEDPGLSGVVWEDGGSDPASYPIYGVEMPRIPIGAIQEVMYFPPYRRDEVTASRTIRAYHRPAVSPYHIDCYSYYGPSSMRKISERPLLNK